MSQSHPASKTLVERGREMACHVRLSIPQGQLVTELVEEIERLMRERDSLLAAIGEHVTVRSEQYAQIQRLRVALSHVKGRAKLRDSATLLDIVRLVDEALSGEHSAHETSGLCPHGMPLAENVRGICSAGRPNRRSENGSDAHS